MIKLPSNLDYTFGKLFKCPVCGEKFLVRYEWGYTYSHEDKIYKLCSYHCMRAMEKKYGDKAMLRKKIKKPQPKVGDVIFVNDIEEAVLVTQVFESDDCYRFTGLFEDGDSPTVTYPFNENCEVMNHIDIGPVLFAIKKANHKKGRDAA